MISLAQAQPPFSFEHIGMFKAPTGAQHGSWNHFIWLLKVRMTPEAGG